MSDIQYDIVIVGGSLGGVAAAWNAAQQGASVCLIEATGRLGRQFNPLDMPRAIVDLSTETAGSSLSYRVFQEAVRSYYNNADSLFAESIVQRRRPAGQDCPEGIPEAPVEHQILSECLAMLPNVSVRLNTKISHVETHDDTIVSVTAVDPIGSTRCRASYFLDATDRSDLSSLCGHAANDRNSRVGRSEDRSEKPAPSSALRDQTAPDILPFVWESLPGEEDRPPAKWTDWDPLHQELDYQTFEAGSHATGESIGDLEQHESRAVYSDCADAALPICPGIFHRRRSDDQAQTFRYGEPEQDVAGIARGWQALLDRLCRLPMECPGDSVPVRPHRSERKHAALFAALEPDAHTAGIRLSRRIRARKTGGCRERDATPPRPTAQSCEDACGIGYWVEGGTHGSTASYPQPRTIRSFPIPLRVLIPMRLKNLLSARENLGTPCLAGRAFVGLCTTHWSIGEAAGALAAYCIAGHLSPSAVATSPDLRKDFQHLLLAFGVPLFCWADITAQMPEFAAVHLLGAYGVVGGSPNQSAFRPNLWLSNRDRKEIESRIGRRLDWPKPPMTRGQTALWLVQTLNL